MEPRLEPKEPFDWEKVYGSIMPLVTHIRDGWKTDSLSQRYENLLTLSDLLRSFSVPGVRNHSNFSDDTKLQLFGQLQKTILSHLGEIPRQNAITIVDEASTLFWELASAHIDEGAPKDRLAASAIMGDDLDGIVRRISANWNDLSRRDRVRLLDALVAHARNEGVVSEERLDDTRELRLSKTPLEDFSAYIDMVRARQWPLSTQGAKDLVLSDLSRSHHYFRTRPIRQPTMETSQ